MFQIKSYLQYKNTPDGKPRVLKQGINYDYSGSEKGEIPGLFEEIEGGLLMIAELADCRPLLTVEIDGVEWTEGVVIYFDGFYDVIIYPEQKTFSDSYRIQFIFNKTDNLIGSFFDDPVKYSKLLWNCSEAEGLEKIFKLLDIDNQ